MAGQMSTLRGLHVVTVMSRDLSFAHVTRYNRAVRVHSAARSVACAHMSRDRNARESYAIFAAILPRPTVLRAQNKSVRNHDRHAASSLIAEAMSCVRCMVAVACRAAATLLDVLPGEEQKKHEIAPRWRE